MSVSEFMKHVRNVLEGTLDDGYPDAIDRLVVDALDSGVARTESEAEGYIEMAMDWKVVV